MVLEDICEFIVDCPHSTAPDESVGYPLIRTPNVGRGRLILEGVHRVSKETYDKRNARAVPQIDDIIFAREAPAGNAALIREGQEVCLGQRTVLIRPDKKKVCPEFLVYYILAPKQQYELLGTANGATVAHVNLPIIRKMPVNLPDIDVQKKIARYIAKYDDLIENNQKQIKLLEEAAQRFYKEWFVDVRFPGHEECKIVDGVPEGWKKVQLGEVFTTVLGGTPSRNKIDYWGGNIPWINSGAVNNLRIVKESEFITELGLSNSSTKIMPVHTTVLAITGATLGQVSYTEIEVCANQSVVGVYDSKDIYNEFIYLTISNKIKEIISEAMGGAQQHINKDVVNRFEVVMPDNDINKKLKNQIKPLFKKITNLCCDIENLKEARDRLLPKLMNGEIEV